MKLLYEVLPAGQIDVSEFFKFAEDTDHLFIPRLSSRVQLQEYIGKMALHATIFTVRDLEDNSKLIACNAVYVNKTPLNSFATFLAVREEYASYGIGAKLIIKAIRYCQEFGSAAYSLKMRASNKVMYDFYCRLGFKKIAEAKYPNSEEIEYELEKTFNDK